MPGNKLSLFKTNGCIDIPFENMPPKFMADIAFKFSLFIKSVDHST